MNNRYQYRGLWGATLVALAAFFVFGSHIVAEAATFSPGDRIEVDTGGSGGLDVHDNPGGSFVGGQSEGARGTVIGGPDSAGGEMWWEVDFDTRSDGWVKEGETALSSGEPTPPPSVTFTASPTEVKKGESTTLTWTSFHTTSCAGTGPFYFDTDNQSSGSIVDIPSRTTEYAIFCTGYGGFVTDTVVVKMKGEEDEDNTVGSSANTITETNPKYPEKGEKDSSRTPVLVWEDVDEADEYHVYLSDSSRLRPDDLIATTRHNIYFLNRPLEGDTTFYWRVDADVDGDTERGESSYFRTTAGPIDMGVADLSPIEEEVDEDSDTTPTLQQDARVRVNTQSVGAVGLNVRVVPSGTKAGGQGDGAVGTIKYGPLSSGDYIWWFVDFDEGADGWVVADFIEFTSEIPEESGTDTFPLIAPTAFDRIQELLNQIQQLREALVVLRAA